jgi:hypothetical protein
MCAPVLDGMVCCRQGLTYNLSAKNLGTANIATLPAENISVDTFELQQLDEILKNGVHFTIVRGN